MKSKLINDLVAANKRLLGALTSVPEDSKITGEWSKKQLLSHIAGWYEEGVDSLPKILKGVKPNSFRKSIDGYNRASVVKRKDKTVEQILKEMEELHTKFVKQISGLSEEQINNYYGTMLGKKQINLLWMINEAISHDNAHAEELEKKYEIDN